MLRYLAVGLGVALIVLLSFLLEAQSQTPAPPPVEDNTPYRIFAPGRVEGLTEEVQLRPQIRGRIVSVPVKEGDQVAAGQVLLQLDPSEYEHEVALAEAALALAVAERERIKNGARQFERDEALSLYHAKYAELELARLANERLHKLQVQSAVSQQEADDQKSKVKSLEAQVAATRARAELMQAPAREDELLIADSKIEAAKSRIELAKVQLARTTLRAAAPGQVMKVNVEPGELAGPDSAEPTLILVDTSRFRVRAFVEELDAPRAKHGMMATVVADGLAEQSFTGRITHLSPRMTAKQMWSDDPSERFDTKAREIWIDLDSGENLVIGLRVDVIIDPQL
jgi:HlyD family secretion protein